MPWVLGERQSVAAGDRGFYGVTPTPGEGYIFAAQGVDVVTFSLIGRPQLYSFELDGLEAWSEVLYQEWDMRSRALFVRVPPDYPSGLTWVFYNPRRGLLNPAPVGIYYFQP